MNKEDWLAFAEARWFAGKGRRGTCLAWRYLDWWGPGPGHAPAGSSEVAVRSEIATIAYPNGELEHYHLIVSYRPTPVTGASLGVHDPVLGYAHDATADPEALAQVLAALHGDQAATDGSWTTTCRHPWSSSPPITRFGGEQSNTNLLLGSESLAKVYRRLEPGPNPDISVLAALNQAGVGAVAELHAWARADVPAITTPDGTALAGFTADLLMVVEQFTDAADGWELALHACRTQADFTTQAHSLGRALADVHHGLASAFGVQSLDGSTVADEMEARLAAAAHAVPELVEFAPDLRARYDHLRHRDLRGQRIHGDFHLGQTLLTADGWRIIDFEGEPLKPIAERVKPDEPLRDVAGLLRSLDYAASAMLQTTADPQWRDQASAAFLAGYGATGDPDALAAYQADRAGYEVLYESRHRPEWVAIPVAALNQLTQGVHS